MKLVDMACPHCGAALKINMDEKTSVCEYCGSSLVIDDETVHIKFDDAEESGYQFEKGRQRAKQEVRSSAKSARKQGRRERREERRERRAERNGTYETAGEKSGKRNTLLWVLGWVFIFPVPLTVIMLRNTRLDKKIRYGIIIGAWILYLLIGIFGVSESDGNAAEINFENNTSTSFAAVISSEKSQTNTAENNKI